MKIELLRGVSPSYVNNYSYLTVMGSRAYGTETPESDHDFYGFVVPPPEIVFPHLNGFVLGFDNLEPFEQVELQHVPHVELGEFDVTIYNITKYFKLVMAGNPNMTDSLFVDEDSVVFQDTVGKMVRRNRHLFLSQKMYHTFRGMLHAHLSRLESGHTKEGRKHLEELHGYDTKDAYHCYRMLFELNQVLREGDLDLKRNSKFLRKVRTGEFEKDYVLTSLRCDLQELERFVEEQPEKIVVPYSPDKDRIRQLLLDCLEVTYGSLTRLGVR